VLPDWSVLAVIAAVLILAVVLDRVLFKPLLRVMREREAVVQAAMRLAEEASTRAREASLDLDAKMSAARADVYRQMDDRRRAAEDHRQQLLGQTRQDVESSLAAARSRLETQTSEARARLQQDADALGEEIVRKVLGRG
jgi:F-type H+-transporting ATPase subunit b